MKADKLLDLLIPQLTGLKSLYEDKIIDLNDLKKKVIADLDLSAVMLDED